MTPGLEDPAPEGASVMGMSRASLEPGLLHRKGRRALGTVLKHHLCDSGSNLPTTSPSLGTWNLVRSVTGDYVGYRLPERAPPTDAPNCARTAGLLRARPRMSAPPLLRPSRAARAPRGRAGLWERRPRGA